MTKSSDDTVRAAGGVVWRPGDHGAPVIAAVHRPRYDDWSLPKGKLDKGEHALAAACREVVEETGLHPVVGPRLPSTSYLVDVGDGPAPKTVDYWSMLAARGNFAANDEVDGLAWLSPAEAAGRMTHDHDVTVIEAFARLPRVTGAVLLVRHAKAGDRQHWIGRDDERPLDRSGQLQAEWLAAQLPWFGPDRVLSGAKTRCRQTVAPLASGLGVPVDIDQNFDEGRHADDPDAVVRRIRDLADDGGVTVVCSQGGVIPDAVDALLADGIDRPPAKTPSRKGSVWALFFADGRLIAADYLATPRP